MGNQIYGLSSSQVVGCEECMQDLQSWVKFEEELSGSRLFKVAKVRWVCANRTTRKIVKIFPYDRNAFSIESIKPMVIPFCQRIEGAINLLPLNIDYLTDKYAYIIRDYVDNSLTERLCTRPFLCLAEKRWIAFQLLCAVKQLHHPSDKTSTPLCHGDIKSENVLLTVWGWLLLVDPAPFKPSRLPSDNPSEFTYFFDSSRRRACYLAPERFVDPPTASLAAAGDNCESAPELLYVKGGLAPDDTEEVLFGEIADEDLRHEDDYDDNGAEATSFTVFRPVNTEHSTHSKSTASSATTAPVRIDRRHSVVFHHVASSLPGSPSTTPNSVGIAMATASPGPSLPRSLDRNAEDRLAKVQLRPAMDLFSVGCVLLEMFTDGKLAFTLADLLEYRRRRNSRLMKLLAAVPGAAARNLISDLLSLHPEGRGTASHHLCTHRGGFFPDFFFTTLQPFMQSFLDPAMSTPAARLARVRANLPAILQALTAEPVSVQSAVSIVLCNLITTTLHLSTASATTTSNYRNSDVVILTNSIVTMADHNLKRRCRCGGHEGSSKGVGDNGVICGGLSEGAKVDALFCLLMLAERVPSLRLFDRLWPYLVELLDAKHHSPEVRRLALESLIQTLERAAAFSSSQSTTTSACASTATSSVCTARSKRTKNKRRNKRGGSGDSVVADGNGDVIEINDGIENDDYAPEVLSSNFLDKFLLPSLAPLATDADTEVRITMARCLPRLADICSRLLETKKKQLTQEDDDEISDFEGFPTTDIDTALRLLSRSASTRNVDAVRAKAESLLRERLVALFSDDSNFVRRTLMDVRVLSRLAVFFGPSRSNDTILSHMVTFLNDKNDPSLRAAFFTQVSPLVRLFGAQSVSVLRPLLEQGLCDPDESVLVSCLRAVGRIQHERLLSGPDSVVFLRRCLALTVHPAAHIRQASIAFVTAFARAGADTATSAIAPSPTSLDTSTVPAAPPLDDRSIELGGAAAIKTSPAPRLPLDVSSFGSGRCGLASVFAHLANDEVTENVFARSVGFCFTRDAVLLANLRPPLEHAFVDLVVQTCLDITEANSKPSPFASSPAASSLQPRITAPQLCTALLEHLQKRQKLRLSSEKNETLWFPPPTSDLVADVMAQLQKRDLSARREYQLLQLAPLLTNLCQQQQHTGALRTTLSPHLQNLRVKVVLSAQSMSSPSTSATENAAGSPRSASKLPVARWRPLPPPPWVNDGVCMRRLCLPMSDSISSTGAGCTKGTIWKSYDPEALPFRLAGVDNKEMSFGMLVSGRMSEGRFPLPDRPPTQSTLVFARALTAADLQEPNTKATNLAPTKEGRPGRRSGGDLATRDGGDGGFVNLRFVKVTTAGEPSPSRSGPGIQAPTVGSVSPVKCPPWARLRASGNSNSHGYWLTLLVHVHEHKAGYLCLASRPAGGLLASCSSGDGQVKMWSCGLHSNFGASSFLSGPASSTIHSKLYEDDGSKAVEEASSPERCHLPSRSLSTYLASRPGQPSDQQNPSCRHLVWTDGGSSVATVANHSAIHLISDAVSCLSSLFQVRTEEHGLATYLAGPSVAFSGGDGGGGGSVRSFQGTDQNLLVYSTTNGNLVGQDVRSHRPAWVIKQDYSHGLIRSLVVHSGHTWLATGTSHASIVTWDLRYHLPISVLQAPRLHPNNGSAAATITRLRIYEANSRNQQHFNSIASNFASVGTTNTTTMILAATSRNNEVVIFDLESSRFIASTTSSSPTQQDRTVYGLLAFPPQLTGKRMAKTATASRLPLLPTLVTGGADARLRCWTLAEPVASAVLALGGHEETYVAPSSVRFRERISDGVRVTEEEGNEQSMASAAAMQAHEATRGHTNFISDLAYVSHDDQQLLISAGMNGVIKFWK